MMLDVLRKRFDAKVQKSEGCWVWTGTLNHSGYGEIVKPRKWGTYQPRVKMLAHRVAWELERGAIPSGLCVLHHCDNPRCVRIDHLFLGDRTLNAADKVTKGRARGPRGEANPNAKLTIQKVAGIKRRLASGEHPNSIAAEHSVSPSLIYNIRSGFVWGHVKP